MRRCEECGGTSFGRARGGGEQCVGCARASSFTKEQKALEALRQRLAAAYSEQLEFEGEIVPIELTKSDVHALIAALHSIAPSRQAAAMTNLRRAYGDTLVTLRYDGAAVPKEIVDVLLAAGGCVDRAVTWMIADSTDTTGCRPSVVNVYIELDLAAEGEQPVLGSVCYANDHGSGGLHCCDCPYMRVVVGGGFLLRVTDREPMPSLEVHPFPDPNIPCIYGLESLGGCGDTDCGRCMGEFGWLARPIPSRGNC